MEWRNRRKKYKEKVELRSSREGKQMMKFTCGVDEGRVELLGEEGVRHVPEELLQQGRHVVDAMLLIQLDVNAAIKLLTQLKDGQKEARWRRRKRGRGVKKHPLHITMGIIF